MKKAYRHGDVIVKCGATIPKGAKKKKDMILAYGEVTGHKHQITEGEASLYEQDDVLYLSVDSETALLTHEEHGPITLPKGDYEINIQREYEPEGWRYVSD